MDSQTEKDAVQDDVPNGAESPSQDVRTRGKEPMIDPIQADDTTLHEVGMYVRKYA